MPQLFASISGIGHSPWIVGGVDGVTFRTFDPPLRPFFRGAMITFTSFPKSKDSFSYAPPKFSTADEKDMDIDLYEDDDDGEDFDSGTKLTCPGEPITSSYAFMRCVLPRPTLSSTSC